jgi:hypothetical protein
VSEDEKQEIIVEQMKKNANAILDSVLDEYPNETAELLGLLCFIEPDDLDNHSMADLFDSANEMLNCKPVIDFFISLASLGRMNTSNASKA